METITHLNGKIVCKISDTGCHEIISHSRHKSGYFLFQINNSRTYAHRVVYMKEVLKVDTLDSNINILHSCDNTSCVNTEHLFIGNRKDNMIDMIKKNRGSNQVLTELDVELIKRYISLNIKSGKELSKLFNVSPQTICDIKYNRIWRHIF